MFAWSVHAIPGRGMQYLYLSSISPLMGNEPDAFCREDVFGPRIVGKSPQKRRVRRGRFPRQAFLLLFRSAAFHVVEDPVPHHEEPGDDHVGQEAGAEEGPYKDDSLSMGIASREGPYCSAGTVFAHASTRFRVASSE